MPATAVTRALLLRSVDYGDADRIVTFLTRDLGKRSALAKGARRSKKRYAGVLEPCAVLEVELVPGRGEVDRLGEARIVRAFPRLLGELRAIAFASAALELVREATLEREPAAPLFDEAERLLVDLDAGGAREERWLAFVARALALLGYEPVLGGCVVCGKRPGEGQPALFDPVRGGIVCRACGGGALKLGAKTRARLRRALDGEDDVAAWTDAEREEARRMMAAFATHQLGRPLAFPGILTAIARTAGPARRDEPLGGG